MDNANKLDTFAPYDEVGVTGTSEVVYGSDFPSQPQTSEVTVDLSAYLSE